MTRADNGVKQAVGHDTNSSSNRITTKWDGLSPGATYTFTVQCKIQGEDCQGDPLRITGSTSCSCRYINILKM